MNAMRKKVNLVAVFGAVLVLALAGGASASSIIELIGADPYLFPASPDPAIFFSPDPEHVMPNPLPVPDPKPNGKVTFLRLVDAVLPEEGSYTTVPIEMTEFWLVGGPVVVDGSFFDVSFSLDTGSTSAGEMTIQRAVGSGYGGTFESFFDVYLDAHFEPSPGSSGTAFDLTTTEHFTMSGDWVGVPLDPEDPEQQRFMVTTPLLVAEDVAHGGVLYLNPIPEPAALSLLALGGLALARRRR